MKKILLTMVTGCVLLSDGCFAMQLSEFRVPDGNNVANMKRCLIECRKNAEEVVEGLKQELKAEKEGQAKAKQELNEAKVKAEQELNEAKVKAEQELKAEKEGQAKVEQELNEAKAKVEQELNAEKAKKETFERELNEAKAKVEQEKEKALARFPLDVPTEGSLVSDVDVAVALSGQIMRLYGSIAFGGLYKDRIITKAAKSVAIYGALEDFLKCYPCSATVTDYVVNNSIHSRYKDFADVIGSSHTGDGPQSFKVKAKAFKNTKLEDRVKTNIVNNVTAGKLQDKESIDVFNKNKTGAIVNEMDCLWLGFLALVEIAEKGTLNGTNLDGVATPLGYTPELIAKLSEILVKLR